MIHILSSTSTTPNFLSSFMIGIKLVRSSIDMDTPTSEVQIMSILVLYFSNTSKTRRKKPYAKSIRVEVILIAMILSLAATALILRCSVILLMVVPGAVGSIVLSRRTGILAYCAGCMQVGCKILAPKYANSAASTKCK